MHRWPCRPYPAVDRELAPPPTPNASSAHQAEPPSPLSVSAWAAANLDFTPDSNQSAILDSPAHRLILLCTRQFGKSTLSAIKALHFALNRPDSLILVAAPIERRAAEWIRLVRRYLDILRVRHRSDAIHPHSAVLPNRSRLIGIPGVVDNNRGYPAHLLIFEEAAVVPDPLFEVLSASLAATNGALWLVSSAGPDFGFFYDQWHNQNIPWTRHKITAPGCPRISPEFLEQERLLIGEAAYRREFLCEFTTLGEKLISRDLLLAAIDPTHKAWNEGKPLWPA